MCCVLICFLPWQTSLLKPSSPFSLSSFESFRPLHCPPTQFNSHSSIIENDSALHILSTTAKPGFFSKTKLGYVWSKSWLESGQFNQESYSINYFPIYNQTHPLMLRTILLFQVYSCIFVPMKTLEAWAIEAYPWTLGQKSFHHTKKFVRCKCWYLQTQKPKIIYLLVQVVRHQ